MRGPSRCTSGRWGSGRRRWAPSIPIRRRASTTSLTYFNLKASTRGRSRCTSGRWGSSKRRSGGPIPSTATSLNNLAGLLGDLGDYAGAKPLYERSLAINEKALGAEHTLDGDEPEQPRGPASISGGLRGGEAALRAVAGDHREGARRGASRYGSEPEQPRGPA